MEEWRRITQLPADPLAEWQARKGNSEKLILGKNKIEALLARWHPFDDLYLAPPGSNQFIPAICLVETKEKIYRSYIRRICASSVILSGAAVALAYIGAIQGKPATIHLAFALASLVFFLVFDFFVGARDPAVLTERSIFYLFVRKNGRPEIIMWTGIMAIAGGTQMLLQTRLGGLEALVVKYGSLYKALDGGEWWRLFTGPFVHVGIFHWSVNLASLLFIAGLGGLISRRFTIFVFLLASLTGDYAGWLFSGFTHQDAYAGVSGGIFGIFGMCAGVIFRKPSYFPRKMASVITSFSVLNILISELVNPVSSLEGHAVGFVTGFAVGILIVSRQQGRVV